MNEYSIEYENMTAKLADVKERLKNCSKGSLRKRLINGGEYYYLQYREGGHIKSQYVKADDVDQMNADIETRKELEKRSRELEDRLSRYAKLMGIHRSYRPVKNVDYKSYTLFMSKVAHDYKVMSLDEFIMEYDVSKCRGLNKRYLAGFWDYVNGIERSNTRKTNDLVLDPYTYLMYFKYGQKDILDEELKRAIPAFLNRGLLITNVQEAVNGSFSK
ncbi:MAG: hypothetical protein J6M92_16760 [Oribacterium sp.]|nr:hypothetical protein [Oribacterium sp.]